jgi:uncharacterized RDD family membrane protein YckC
LNLNVPVDESSLELQGLVAASLRRRFAASIIDALIYFPIGFMVATALGHPFLSTEGERSVVNTLIVLLIAGGLEHLFLIRTSATPGKLLLGIYVGTTSGGRVGHLQAIFRDLVFALFFVDYLLPSAGLLSTAVLLFSFVMALNDPWRRTLHDRLAGTLVLVGKPPARAPQPETAFPRL